MIGVWIYDPSLRDLKKRKKPSKKRTLEAEKLTEKSELERETLVGESGTRRAQAGIRDGQRAYKGVKPRKIIRSFVEEEKVLVIQFWGVGLVRACGHGWFGCRVDSWVFLFFFLFIFRATSPASPLRLREGRWKIKNDGESKHDWRSRIKMVRGWR